MTLLAAVAMKPETAEMLQKLEYELFESEEHASTRAVLNCAPKNSGDFEDIDTVFDRIDEYVPSMQRFIDTFLKIPAS
jgi:hypothetical protein